MQNLIGKIKELKPMLAMRFYTLIMLSICPLLSFAADTDLLKPAAGEVNATIGHGSTLWVIIYTLEILAAGYSSVIKKNLPVFLGIVAMVIFTTVAFAVITQS